MLNMKLMLTMLIMIITLLSLPSPGHMGLNKEYGDLEPNTDHDLDVGHEGNKL